MSVRLGEDADFLVIDTPGRDDRFARIAVTNADTLVTPMNDSFVASLSESVCDPIFVVRLVRAVTGLRLGQFSEPREEPGATAAV